MHPRESGLAAEVRALAERAQTHAATTLTPKPPTENVVSLAAEPAPSVPDRSIASDSAPSDTDAERKHVTILAVEIVSPLHAFASMDPELVSREMDPLLDSTSRIVEQHGGIVS